MTDERIGISGKKLNSNKKLDKRHRRVFDIDNPPG